MFGVPQSSRGSLQGVGMFFFFFFCAVLREEDYPDKPNEYIENCIGMSEPVAKVCHC